ncbi:MAG: ATP synthase F1 subunit gamma [Phycisphaerales bacterium]|nr:ATP synthase F1 subunit gamma [Phycisphaerales bacterium]
MAKARAIVKRRKAVRNIKKITQTMQLIATARFQKCLQRAIAGRPYTERMSAMIESLSAAGSADHPLLAANDGVSRGVLLTITSNRGLCGSYNSAVLRQAGEVMREQQAAGRQLSIEVVGKKGLGYLRFLGISAERSITDVEDRIAYARVADMADRYIAMYTERKISAVDVVYTRYVSAGVQRAARLRLLPIEPPKSSDAAAAARTRIEFEYSPGPQELLGRLIPEMVKIRLYQCFNDSIVSEQVARMVAMKSATEAAGDMIKSLTSSYNRARQSGITMELLDIMGGASAIDG